MNVIWKLKHGQSTHWEMWIEHEKWLEVHRTIFGRHPSFPSFSSLEELPALFDAFEYDRVKRYLLWRLSAQSYHSEQLIKLLKERLVQLHTIEQIITEFKNIGYLDDQAWIKSFIRSQEKRYGRPMILSKLRSKGLSSSSLEQLAADWEKAPQQEMSVIKNLLQTRYRSKDFTQYKEKQKVIASLLRKGYSFDQVNLAFQNNDDEENHYHSI